MSGLDVDLLGAHVFLLSLPTLLFLSMPEMLASQYTSWVIWFCKVRNALAHCESYILMCAIWTPCGKPNQKTFSGDNVLVLAGIALIFFLVVVF